MISSAISSLLTGVVFGVLLNVFFSSVRHAWPQIYFTLEEGADSIVSRNVFRYLAFRFAPLFVAVVASSLTAERFGGLAVLAGVTAAAVNSTNLVRDALGAARRFRPRPIVTAVGIGIAIAITTGVAILTRATFSSAVPRPQELVANIWAGLIAAIGAVYLQRVVLYKKSPPTLVEKSLSEIPTELGKLAVARSRERGLDHRVPIAVMVAENMQRPPWFRWLEFRLLWFYKATTGLMQQQGAKNEEESVERGVDIILDRLSSPQPGDAIGYAGEYAQRRRAFRATNSSDQIEEIAQNAFNLFEGNPALLERFDPSET